MQKLAVMSGKGGVGKSSVSVLLAAVLAEEAKVLILDFDLCGPSCAKMVGACGSIKKLEKGFDPVKVSDNIYILSMGSMIKEEDAVIWRGPKKLSLLELFYESIDGYDAIICDMPPGMSEEHEFIVDKDFEVVFVTTSQNVALQDTLRAVDFCKGHNMKIKGIVENMSGYECVCCGEINNVFAANGGRQLASVHDLQFICALPVEPKWCILLDNGTFLKEFKTLRVYEILRSVVKSGMF